MTPGPRDHRSNHSAIPALLAYERKLAPHGICMSFERSQFWRNFSACVDIPRQFAQIDRINFYGLCLQQAVVSRKKKNDIFAKLSIVFT